MNDQTGKTKEDILEDMRAAAEAAMSSSPPEPKEEPAAPESDEKTEKPSEEGDPEQLKAEDPTPAPEEKKVAEKYQGKSQEDLIKMLDDKDSYFGKLGSERVHEREETEKLRAELETIKADFVQKKTQDQDAAVASVADESPEAKIIVDYIDKRVGEVETKASKERSDQQAEDAIIYYRSRLENPDFSRRRDHVDKVAHALAPYVKSEYIKSKDFVEICDLISKGTDIEYYIERTKSELGSQKEADLKEKREAQTVSGSSSNQSGSAASAESTEEERRAAAQAAFAKLRG